MRTTAAGVPHYVVLHGNNGRRLFVGHADFQLFVDALVAAMQPTGYELNAVGTTNFEARLLVTPGPDVALPWFIKNLSQRYAQRRNRLRNDSGRLFETNFFSQPLLDDNAVAIATLLVDRAGQAAGVSRRLARCSTLGLHLDQAGLSLVPRRWWTPTVWYACLGATASERALVYRQWADRYPVEETQPRPSRIERPSGTRAF